MHLRCLLTSALLMLVASSTEATTFPVSPSANGRYLQDADGVPFPILGRTAWFVTSVKEPEYKIFFDDTAAKGYTAVELHVINHDPHGHNEPYAGNNTLPFLKTLSGGTWGGSLVYSDIKADAPDLTKPNEAYWAYVDGLLDYAESTGLLVFLFPGYVGYAGGQAGWMQELVANGPARVQSYGAWIAARYVARPNIIWMMGGDMGTTWNPFNPEQTAVEQALLAGLKSVPGQQSTLFSAEWNSESIATDQVALGSAMTLNGAYSWTGEVSTFCRVAYGHTPIEPAFLLEEPYDEEGPDGNGVNPSATQPVRRFQWWGWLSSIGGYVSGNGYVWPFNHAWQLHMDTPGAQDMARLNSFINSIQWQDLVPSGLGGMGTIVTAGGSFYDLDDYVSAAATPDGKLLVAYVPPAHTGTITINMTKVTGLARARWFNPTTAEFTLISDAIPGHGTHVFTPPGDNGSGFTDWVLILDVTAWTDLGDGKPGVAGIPVLSGSGELVVSQPNSLEVTSAAPDSEATLVFGFAGLGAPFKGGSLVPTPLLLQSMPTNAAGAADLTFDTPTGLPSGTELYFQAWIEDAAATFGISATNALLGSAP